MNLKHKLLTTVIIIVCGLWTVDRKLLYSQQDNLEVKGEIQAESLTIQGGDCSVAGVWPQAPVKGEVFYCTDENAYYVFDGTDWQALGGGGDKVVATRVVAAYNSDTHDGPSSCLGDGSACDNPKADFTCDGTDDQLKIQQAIDALGANPGVVYLLEGTYNISGAINLNNIAPDDSGKAIIGAGKGTILTAQSGVDVINASNVNRILIAQLMVEGNDAATSGIYLNSVTDSKIDKTWVENTAGIGIMLWYADNNTVSNNFIQGNDNYGLETVYANNDIISGNTINSNDSMGIRIYGGTDITITNNSIANNVSNGIQLYAAASYNTVSANILTHNDTAGAGGNIVLVDANSNSITGNTVQESMSLYGIILTTTDYLLTPSVDNTVTGNTLRDNACGGIYIVGGNRNVVSGNRISEITVNAPAAPEYLHGIYLNLASSNIISGNRISDTSGTAGYGINIYDNTCSNNYLVGNFIDGTGFGTRLIQDNGLTTAYTDKTKLTFEPVAGYTGLTNGGTLTPNGPASFIRLDPNDGDVTLGTPALLKGKSAGDLLVLENTSPLYKVKFTEQPDLRLVEPSPNLELSQNEVLTLIWDATSSDCCWVQTGGKGS